MERIKVNFNETNALDYQVRYNDLRKMFKEAMIIFMEGINPKVEQIQIEYKQMNKTIKTESYVINVYSNVDRLLGNEYRPLEGRPLTRPINALEKVELLIKYLKGKQFTKVKADLQLILGDLKRLEISLMRRTN
ncbi:hypothetical protein HN385_03095 [archaeon]|jgi:hypothetical protein|nr:hypothetical protein [archaeon]MBT3450825.1 hypothetical protein [archaeon]MBT6868466.1 hypothetical protein [archaeon]MBT7193565.1 hypothetical protein [archaeon]MBT7381240.1 hypothetical protein [archaeon]